MTAIAFRFAGVWSHERHTQTLEDGLEPTIGWSDDLFQWVHVADIARGIRKALEADRLTGGAYTLGAGDTRCPEPTMTLLEQYRPDLAQTLKESLPGRAPLLSIAKSQEAFGYDPQFRMGD